MHAVKQLRQQCIMRLAPFRSVPHGEWHVPALQMPLNIVVGRPIEVPQRADPSAEEVERYLQQYIAAIERIFEQHKAAAGHPAAKLTIY